MKLKLTSYIFLFLTLSSCNSSVVKSECEKFKHVYYALFNTNENLYTDSDAAYKRSQEIKAPIYKDDIINFHKDKLSQNYYELSEIIHERNRNKIESQNHYTLSQIIHDRTNIKLGLLLVEQNVKKEEAIIDSILSYCAD
jgi:hypothetical protein